MRPSLLAPGLLLAASLLAASTALAQDLAPPSTGPAAGTPGSAGPSQPQATHLDADEKKDSGRGLEWVYLNANAGFAWANMVGISDSNLAVQKTSSQGPAFGVGAGLRLFILTIGGRATLNELSDFNLWQLDAELGLHIPLGHWEPYFGLHGGYCFVGALDAGVSGSPNLSVTGGDAGLQLGLDYYFNHYISMGVQLDGSALFLHRAVPSLPSAVAAQLSASGELAAYQQTGDSVGVAVVPSFHLALHL